MGLFDRNGLTYGGYGGSVHLSEGDAMMSRLTGIGKTTQDGITGTPAIDAVQRFAATGASEQRIREFADRIARQHGR